MPCSLNRKVKRGPSKLRIEMKIETVFILNPLRARTSICGRENLKTFLDAFEEVFIARIGPRGLVEVPQAEINVKVRAFFKSRFRKRKDLLEIRTWIASRKIVIETVKEKLICLNAGRRRIWACFSRKSVPLVTRKIRTPPHRRYQQN